MLNQLTEWLVRLFKQALGALLDLLKDLVVWVVDVVTSAIATLINSIGVPDFLSNGLSTLFSGLDPGIMYVLSRVGLPAALGIIGAGYTFRLIRKVVTLFQW